MNTFGKILVVCNLLGVLAALGLQVAVLPRHKNWAEHAKLLQDELIVARENNKAKLATLDSINEQAKHSEANTKSMAKQLDQEKLLYKDEVESLKAQITALNVAKTEADLSKDQILQQNARLKLENDALTKALQSSEQDKLASQDEANKYRKQTEDYKNERDATQRRNENLAKIIRQKDNELAELAARGGAPGSSTTMIVKGPNDANPPPVRVNGQIMEVNRNARDGLGVLVTLSVGKDHGVEKNHTLDVYRPGEYLGRVRIINIGERDSIGRLERSPANTIVRVGDLVTDSVENIRR